MAHDTAKQGVLFENLSKKVVIAKFDRDHANSDGGALLLKACDENLKLRSTLASCLSDDRQQSRVTYSLEELFQQPLDLVTVTKLLPAHCYQLADCNACIFKRI